MWNDEDILPSVSERPFTYCNCSFNKFYRSEIYTAWTTVLHGPSGVPQFDQVVKGTGDQLVLMGGRPLHSSDPASVGGQRKQHKRAIWRGEEANGVLFQYTHTNNLFNKTQGTDWKLEDACTFSARVPQSDVSVGAAWGQPSTQRRVRDTIEHFTARLFKGQS